MGVAVVGGLFLVGMAVAMLISVLNCSSVALVQTAKYGALWALLPSVVFMLTQNALYTAGVSLLPTLYLIGAVDSSVCGGGTAEASSNPPLPTKPFLF